MDQTPTQALASLNLGQDVTEWALAQRNSDPSPSFQVIADRLRDLTEVRVTDQTIRLWCASYADREAVA